MAIVLYQPNGHIDHTTTTAQQLLTSWFGTKNGHLPRALEQAYAKLGVHSRTAAVARLSKPSD